MNIQSIMKKQTIFDTTLKLITQQGLHATPVSQIAHEAKVAAGTIYHYFNSKEHLLEELYLSVLDELNIQTSEIDLDGGDLKTTFLTLWITLFKFFIQNPLKFLFLDQYEHVPAEGVSTAQHMLKINKLNEVIQAGITREEFVDVPEPVLEKLFLSSVTSIVHIYLSETVTIETKTVQIAMECAWNSVKR